MRNRNIDHIIVGCGFFGAVLAERLASELDRKVLILEKRAHIGGNCYSEKDSATGIEYHKYGTHIFHTSNPRVWNYISPFMELNGYRHQVLARHGNRTFQLPINLETINSFFGMDLNPTECRKFLQQEIDASPFPNPGNFEEKAISLVGQRLYEAFFKGYTQKHWGKHPRELPASIVTRLPVRFNYREDYFNHGRWQGVPVDGYTRVFERLLAHPNISVETDTDYFDARNLIEARRSTIYTGPIDRYFDFAHGRLEWRSVRFEARSEPVEDYLGTAVMNYADASVAYTRQHEPRHLHPERVYPTDRTLVIKEYPCENADEPYYPVRSERNMEIFAKYRALALKERNLIFGGRLGDYAYYDMDMVIAAALKCFEKIAHGAEDDGKTDST